MALGPSLAHTVILMRFFAFLCAAALLLPACDTEQASSDCTEASLITAYRDEDRDGHGDPNTATQRCEVGIGGWVSTGLDCDDTNSNVNPDMLEECDGLDNNCNQEVDEFLRGITYYLSLIHI